MRRVNSPLTILTSLARDLQRPGSLDDLLQRIIACAAELVGARRASLRLLDPTGARLLAVCRAGTPLHLNPSEEFKIGEGLQGWIAAHLQPIRTGEAERDPRFVIRAGMKERLGSFLGVPIVSGSACLGVLSATKSEEGAFTREHEDALLLLAAICAPYIEIGRLSRLATVDPLTGALNRRGLDRAFPEVAAAGDGVIHPLCVAMVDLDHFKRINDAHGHAVGDEVLKHTARVLAGVVRGGDAVIRYGGEEFLLVMCNVDLASGARVAERARAAVGAADLVIGGHRIHVTASFGVAERREGEPRDALIHRADAALYEAKRGGRDRVALSS